MIEPETMLVATISAIFASQGFWTWLINRNAKKSSQAQLIMGLGFGEICRKADMYLERESITTEEYKDLYKYLYKPYKDMGGNGTAKKLMAEVGKLPIREQ